MQAGRVAPNDVLHKDLDVVSRRYSDILYVGSEPVGLGDLLSIEDIGAADRYYGSTVRLTVSKTYGEPRALPASTPFSPERKKQCDDYRANGADC